MSTVPKELREYFDMADVDENNQRGTIGTTAEHGRDAKRLLFGRTLGFRWQSIGRDPPGDIRSNYIGIGC